MRCVSATASVVCPQSKVVGGLIITLTPDPGGNSCALEKNGLADNRRDEIKARIDWECNHSSVQSTMARCSSQQITREDMTMKLMKVLAVATLINAAAFFLYSCATVTMPASPDGMIVKTWPSLAVRIEQTSARQEGEDVVVNGELKRKKAHRRSIPKGHVDIAVVDGEGKTIYQSHTQYHPETIPIMDDGKSTFTARLPVHAPHGSFVSVKFHTGSHDL